MLGYTSLHPTYWNYIHCLVTETKTTAVTASVIWERILRDLTSQWPLQHKTQHRPAFNPQSKTPVLEKIIRDQNRFPDSFYYNKAW